MTRSIPYAAPLALALVLVALAVMRPVDHDESQYVAAAVLTGQGLLPYRDFAYLQTPLQPFLFAPVASLAGLWAWPALRVVNALLGAMTIGLVFAAARSGGAKARMAFAAAALFCATDILLFSFGTARNDALPAACFAAGLWLAVEADRGRGTRLRAVFAGLLFAAAAAAKVSYAFPAAAYGFWTLTDHRHRARWVVAGATPVVAFVAWTFALAPQGFWFGVFTFPAQAPSDYYKAIGKAWKLSFGMKLVDTIKFLALGPSLLALAIVARGTGRRPRMLDWLIVAGLFAALLPSPTWRQYLLPVLPPLFIRLAQLWSLRPPGRAMRITAVVFACAGLAPTVQAIVTEGDLVQGVRESRAIAATMDAAGVDGPVATLAPQFLASTGRLPDPRFAAGPFYFRNHGFATAAQEQAMHLICRDSLPRAPLPPAVLVGGESAWVSGDDSLDVELERWAVMAGYRRLPVVGTHFELYVMPR